MKSVLWCQVPRAGTPRGVDSAEILLGGVQLLLANAPAWLLPENEARCRYLFATLSIDLAIDNFLCQTETRCSPRFYLIARRQATPAGSSESPAAPKRGIWLQ